MKLYEKNEFWGWELDINRYDKLLNAPNYYHTVMSIFIKPKLYINYIYINNILQKNTNINNWILGGYSNIYTERPPLFSIL